jgi:hypothetical protein
MTPNGITGLESVKLATVIPRPRVIVDHTWGTGKILLYYTWYLLLNLATCIFQILASGWHLMLCCRFGFSLSILSDIKMCLVLVSCCTWAEFSLISWTACCSPKLSPFPTIMDNRLEYSRGNWHITVSQVPLHCQGFVLASKTNQCPFVQMMAHR